MRSVSVRALLWSTAKLASALQKAQKPLRTAQPAGRRSTRRHTNAASRPNYLTASLTSCLATRVHTIFAHTEAERGWGH